MPSFRSVPFRRAGAQTVPAAAALAVALGCGGGPLPAERGCPGCPLPTTRPEALAAAACPDWQWVGITEEPACPPIPGWEVTEILAAPRQFEPAPRLEPPGKLPPPERRGPGLRRYCRYTDRGRGAVATLLAEGARRGVDPLDRDCMAVIPLAAAPASPGSPADGETRRWRELERVFLARAGRPAGPVPAGLPAAGDPVRLVLIDTVANREANGQPPWSAPANSPHGVSLASMAKRLTCRGNDEPAAGGECAAVEVEAELALAHVSFDRFSAAGSVRDDVAGGYVGTMSDLAEAIRRAVERPGPARRVLNLSVGWNGYLFGGLEDDPADMPAPVRAVLDALGLAAARGVPAAAAAGNRNWGPAVEVDVGPMLPAAWAVREAAGGGALLEAAGGLSFESFTAPPGFRELPNARFRALPRLLAFADHAVVERHRGNGGTATLTGTSVSSLVVATSAAAAWLYLPGTTGRAVVDRVFEAGEPAGVAVDFCLGGGLAAPDPGRRHPRGLVPAPACPSGDPARRLRLCAAAAAACRAAGAGNCPSCGSGDVPAPEVDHDALDRFDGAPAFSLAGRVPLRPPEHDLCPPAPTRVELAGAAARNDRLRGTQSQPPGRERFFPGPVARAQLYRCPYWQFSSLGSVPWVDPAPESIPCSTCDFESTSPATVYLELDPLFQGRPVSAPVLLVGDDAYELEWDPQRQPRAIVEDVPYENGEAVYLAFALDGEPGRLLSAVGPLVRVRDGD